MFFFFNDTATTEIYTLSLHDALPIYSVEGGTMGPRGFGADPEDTWEAADTMAVRRGAHDCHRVDRKSTRLNSSHLVISYAVFCLKKKKRHRTGALSSSRTA